MPASILIVEDNPTNLELMVYLLDAFGYKTCTAGNGVEALARLAENPVDLVVCDLEMPVMDGYSFARQVRAAGTWRSLTLVAVSAYAMVGDREKVMLAGFDGYIAKPIDPETFVETIQRFLPPDLRAHVEPQVVEALSAPVPFPPTVASILVLDDSPTNLTLMRSTLEPSGYQVVSAIRIQEAQAHARQSRPDLIICDLHLDRDNGLDFLRWIKGQSGLASVPCMIVTGSSTDSFDHAASLQAGATRFLVRPIDPETLLAEVRTQLAAAS
jgi:CheY-like chemotaxis protein